MVSIGPFSDDAVADELATVAAPLQANPARYQAYFGNEADEIAAEIEEIPEWRDHTIVATDGDELVGWIIAEFDDEIGRVWWWGPVVSAGHDWSDVASQLLEAALDRLDNRFDQFEFAVDARHLEAIDLATGNGFRRDEGSVLLELDGIQSFQVTASPPALIDVITAGDAPAAAALHDQLFPDTHLTGNQLTTDADDLVLVARVESVVVGYLTAEVQASGSGYLDFVGVDPEHRSGGIGRALVERSIADLAKRGVNEVSLTVRESNQAARALYARLGFNGDRILVPLRSGFHV